MTEGLPGESFYRWIEAIFEITVSRRLSTVRSGIGKRSKNPPPEKTVRESHVFSIPRIPGAYPNCIIWTVWEQDSGSDTVLCEFHVWPPRSDDPWKCSNSSSTGLSRELVSIGTAIIKIWSDVVRVFPAVSEQ